MNTENLEGVKIFMNKVHILGLGPGNSSYILPVTKEIIKDSDIIIGGKRNIESILELVENKEIYYVDVFLDKMINYIEANNDKKISVIVSGDTGFYSLLTYIKNNYSGKLEVISGISSMQYMFSKICETWDNAFISSVHGRELDFQNYLKAYKKIGLLTDNKYTPQNIAKILLEQNLTNFEIIVGENLSYDNEIIRKYKVEQLAFEEKKFDINVVVIREGKTCTI